MIHTLKLKHFRNFKELVVDFREYSSFIIGENGKGKTNLLEALALLSGNSIINIHPDNLVYHGENNFYIEYQNDIQTVSMSYEKHTKKRRYNINGKTVSKKKFLETSDKSVIFSPMFMNMMYLSPSLRRDFLDGILKSSFVEYEGLYKKYKNILKSRNLVLKNIAEGKAKIEEIHFWDTQFIDIAEHIYTYRFRIIQYIQNTISQFLSYFNGTVSNIELIYKTKVSRETPKTDIQNYIQDNLQRDIILKKTYIGPHIDDFDILLDGIPIAEFASRGETKSIIMGLKMLELQFIKEISGKKVFLIIDDFLSEIDSTHRDALLENIGKNQTFISSIENIHSINGIKKQEIFL